MIWIIVLCLVVAVLIYGFIADRRDTRAHEKAMDDWLADEMAKPKWHLRIITLQGEVHHSQAFDPFLGGYSKYAFRYTSHEMAHEKAAGVLARGLRIGDLRIPYHQIRQINVVQGDSLDQLKPTV